MSHETFWYMFSQRNPPVLYKTGYKVFCFLDFFMTHSLEYTVSVTVYIKIFGYSMGMQSIIYFDLKLLLQCFQVFNLLAVKKNLYLYLYVSSILIRASRSLNDEFSFLD